MDSFIVAAAGFIERGLGAYVIAPAFISMFLTEYLIFRARSQYGTWSRGDALPNAISAAIGFWANAIAWVFFAGVYQWAYETYRLVTLPMSFLGILAAYFVFEMFTYFRHRLSHRTGLFWAIHSVHHSSEEMNILVSDRFLWGVVLTMPGTMLLMPAFGVSLTQYAMINLVLQLYGAFNHTRLVPKLGLLEHVIVTPANHRVHHGRQTKYLDRNYGLSLLIFDKMFGTHQIEEEEPDYGLVNSSPERNPFKFQIAGLRELGSKISSASRLSDKLGYLWRPPGWCHLGNHTTTEALVERERSQNTPVMSTPPSSASVSAQLAGS